MATKIRKGSIMPGPFVPNDIWDLFKKTLRARLKNSFPDLKLKVSEYYWQGFPLSDEYICIAADKDVEICWETVFTAVRKVAKEFYMNIRSIHFEQTAIYEYELTNPFPEISSSKANLILYSTKTDWTAEGVKEFAIEHAPQKGAKNETTIQASEIPG